MDSSSTLSSDWLASIMRLLDEKLCPVEVSARFTEAAFWHSQEVAIRPGQSNGWLVLVGDAACGRPFYLGSTLNGHIHDVVPLAQSTPWSNWDPHGMPIKKYVERYRLRTSAKGFRRTGRPCSANKTCASLPPLPPSPTKCSGSQEPSGCPLSPSYAVSNVLDVT